MSVPNHSQASRIRFDLQRLQNGQPIDAWIGNSYRGYSTTFDGHRPAYVLRHWSTVIASFAMLDGQLRLIEFRAAYISSTTRGFQGRILNAMRTALGDNHPDVVRVAAELALPTHQRGHIVHDLSLGHLTVIG